MIPGRGVDVDVVWNGAAFPAARTELLSSGGAVEEPGQGDPGDSPRGRRARHPAIGKHRSGDEAQRGRALAHRNGSELFEISVYQVRAAKTGSGLAYERTGSAAPPMLDTSELTILSCWAEAVADALAFAPEQLEAIRATPTPVRHGGPS